MLNNLILYRLTIINLLGLLGIGYAHSQGWVERVVLADHTGVVWVVIAFFVLFEVSLYIRATKVATKLNALKRREVVIISPAKFDAKAAHLDEMPGWIMLIGLLGNVLGIMLAVKGANLGGSDPQQAIVNLLGSMDVAFSATLVSGVLGIWASILGRMLKTATALMIDDAMEAEYALPGDAAE